VVMLPIEVTGVAPVGRGFNHERACARCEGVLPSRYCPQRQSSVSSSDTRPRLPWCVQVVSVARHRQRRVAKLPDSVCRSVVDCRLLEVNVTALAGGPYRGAVAPLVVDIAGRVTATAPVPPSTGAEPSAWLPDW